MLTRLSHTTPPSARETMTLEAYAANHARNLDVKAEPVALQRWAQKSKDLIEQLVQRVDALEKDAARYLHICEQDFKDRQWVDGFAEFKKARDTTIDAAMGITGEPK